ncbi:MAG: hypothetical protein DCC68_07020 [Planctomycetota bacterium]|nr:MAG: hypothetical protein DCC68_07020 [Planctomycetota bacterium]
MHAAPLEIAAPPRPLTLARRSATAILAHVVTWACLAGLLVAAAVLAARRAQGMLASPLPVAPMLVAGMFVATLTVLAQWRHARRIVASRGRTITAADVAALGSPAAIAVLIAAMITLPGTRFAAAALLWSPLLAGQAALVWLYRPHAIAPHQRDPELPVADATSAPGESAPQSFDELGEEHLPDDATQHWTRRTIDGADVLEGMARASFAAGARAVNVHVGICPPFANVPEVFAEPIDGPAATVAVAEALPFGVRLDVRLVEASHAEASVIVAVVARG